MRISIFGLGYVGAVSAGCLAREGHSVIGVDPYQPKVDLINSGQTPVIEAEIGDIVASAVAAGTTAGNYRCPECGGCYRDVVHLCRHAQSA